MNVFYLLTIVIVYLAVITYLGYKGYKTTKNSTDYMIGGRTIHPYVMALSYGATFISTAAIVGFGGISSLFGMSLLWLPFANIAIGIFVAFVFFGKRTRRIGLNLDAHTFPEFLGKRFDSPFIQSFSGFIIFIFMPLYAAAVLIGASRIIEGLLDIPYIYSVAIFSILVASYVLMGGLKGVMYTDALQGTLMFCGMLILLVFIYINLGGITSAHSSLTNLADKIPQGLQDQGLTNWTSSPRFGSQLWWVIYSSLVLGVGIGVLAQPQLVVRYMTVKSNKELNRAVLIGGIFILVTTGSAYIVGALSNVFFFENFDKISIAMAKGNTDSVIPLFIAEAMPSWFGYLFMLVILSAGMSTLSSQFHTIGTSIGRDIYKNSFSKYYNKKYELLVTKVGMVVAILATIFLGIQLEKGIVARATAIFFGLMASSFLFPYILSIYWKKVTKAGAISGIISGFTITVFLFLLVSGKEARVFGLSQLFFSRDTLIPGIMEYVDPLVFALPISGLSTIVVSLFTKVTNHETIETAFEGIKN